MQNHTESVQAALLGLNSDRQALLEAWKAMIGGDGAPMFPLDLLASGAVKRAISASSAMKLLVGSWNMVTARSLLRTHILISETDEDFAESRWLKLIYCF